MSANIAVINFTAGGTLTVAGKTTLGDQLLSMNSGSFQGLSTTSLAVSGASTFNGSLPTSTQTPTSDTQLTTKVYVDGSYNVLNTFIFGGLANITPNVGIQNISVGSNTTNLRTGTGNTVFGRGIMTTSTSASNNVLVGQAILQSYNPSSAAGNNVALGQTIMQSLTNGISNVSIGNYSLPNITTTQENTAIGTSSGQKILGNFNTCVGAASGQALNDSNVYNRSCAIGYNSAITSSNQIMLGTSYENVVCPNSIITGSIIAREATGAGIGSIQNAGGISCSLGSWFNGIIDSGLTTLSSMTATSISCSNANVRCPPIVTTSSAVTYVASQFGVNQFIQPYNASPAAQNTILTLPNPNTCPGQMLYIWNGMSNISTCTLKMTGSGIFGNKGSINQTQTLNYNGTYFMIAAIGEWVILSIT